MGLLQDFKNASFKITPVYFQKNKDYCSEEQGYNLLHLAVWAQRADLIRQILHFPEGLPLVNKRTPGGWSPLHMAAYHPDPSLWRTLVELTPVEILRAQYLRRTLVPAHLTTLALLRRSGKSLPDILFGINKICDGTIEDLLYLLKGVSPADDLSPLTRDQHNKSLLKHAQDKGYTQVSGALSQYLPELTPEAMPRHPSFMLWGWAPKQSPVVSESDSLVKTVQKTYGTAGLGNK
jgi:hypothetical protein